jgi:PadR family transcriptional regulator, regulatory protein PadR
VSHDPQLLKGVLSALLLRLLAERESYGYELVGRLRDLGLDGIAEGTVYPALARLEREGRVAARLIASRSGPARKYYRPTKAGYSALADSTANWLALADAVTPVLSGPLPPEPAPPAEEA